MALLISLTFGLGLFLIYGSLTAKAKPPEARRSRLQGRIDTLLSQAGVEAVGAREFLVISIVAGVVVCLLSQAAMGWPLVSLALGFVGAGLPTWYFAAKAERRSLAMRAALADAVDALRSSVRTGMSAEEGIAGLAANGPEILRPVFRELSRDMRLSGFEDAIERAQERMGDAVFDSVAIALRLSHRVGGRHLGSVLDGLSHSVRLSVQVQNEARAQQARNVLSARVIAALPVLLVFMIRGVNPSYLDAFSTPAGQAVMAACLVSVAVGYAGMLWATRLPKEERVLTWQ